MFYETATNDHGLPYNPLKACVLPRPIGWISTLNGKGQANLAPFSFFNLVSERPPLVIFCPNGPHAEGGEKDSLLNLRENPEFVVNLATYSLRHEINASAAPWQRDKNEFEAAGVTEAASVLVSPPRVKESPLHLECTLEQIIQLPGEVGGVPNHMVLGRILGVHVDDEMIVDGQVRPERLQAISRLGYMDYAVVDKIFTMPRPTTV
ncbi:flavin reductase family protein [Limibacillus halophilus]|uniref:Flavin reductase (DIM6/NTAB) family NADH-FMN oxidoreductase RutF n=1 Tax=Limibacillus halophilus TaxID=1579333 RepID=A0A839SSJ0_9PROT|nr:flavin reductase family protein [Limibacillus halophilus]MBB3064306.1 flavin reductase (DIM6/NTAB) family NADH-FMN oxidoreductase RutF [Limibacillus halophilus]